MRRVSLFLVVLLAFVATGSCKSSQQTGSPPSGSYGSSGGQYPDGGPRTFDAAVWAEDMFDTLGQVAAQSLQSQIRKAAGIQGGRITHVAVVQRTSNAVVFRVSYSDVINTHGTHLTANVIRGGLPQQGYMPQTTTLQQQSGTVQIAVAANDPYNAGWGQACCSSPNSPDLVHFFLFSDADPGRPFGGMPIAMANIQGRDDMLASDSPSWNGGSYSEDGWGTGESNYPEDSNWNDGQFDDSYNPPSGSEGFSWGDPPGEQSMDENWGGGHQSGFDAGYPAETGFQHDTRWEDAEYSDRMNYPPASSGHTPDTPMPGTADGVSGQQNHQQPAGSGQQIYIDKGLGRPGKGWINQQARQDALDKARGQKAPTTPLVKGKIIPGAVILPVKTVPDVTAQAGPYEQNVDRPGGNLGKGMPIADARACLEACRKNPICRAFTYVRPGVQGPEAMCWLKKSVTNPVPNTCCISGVAPAKKFKDLFGSKKMFESQ